MINGTGDPRPGVDVEDVGHPVEHLAVGEHVGAADLNLPARRRFGRPRLDEIAQRVVDRDRLGRVAEVGQRRAVRAERERSLVPAAQVLGPRPVTEAARRDRRAARTPCRREPVRTVG